jgi:hypothetical protein
MVSFDPSKSGHPVSLRIVRLNFALRQPPALFHPGGKEVVGALDQEVACPAPRARGWPWRQRLRRLLASLDLVDLFSGGKGGIVRPIPPLFPEKRWGGRAAIWVTLAIGAPFAVSFSFYIGRRLRATSRLQRHSSRDKRAVLLRPGDVTLAPIR